MSAISKPSVIGGDLISAFSHSSQRPPVPGEEDDQCRTDIAVSKKLAAGCLLNGVSQQNLPSDRCTNSQVYVRTPSLHRHTILDGGRERPSTKLDCRSDSPPLGFEPEGSACASPRFKENSSSASSTGGGGGLSYLRWAESLKLLLEDSEGVRLFKQFLEQEQGCSAALDFWFACTGLKMVAHDQERVAGLAKMIYKRYVKGDRLRLTADARRRVVDRLRQHQIDPAMFDEAQAEVELTMRSDDYPLFLKSDTYLQYVVQSGSESPLMANVSGTNTNCVLSTDAPTVTDCIIRPLPTVTEDEELAIDDIWQASVASSLSLTPSALFATRRSREAVTTCSYVGISFPKCSHTKLANPYHISYAPVSAQDSELQSLSSDALTDDTMSYTDSSVDGRERVVFTSKRKQLKAIRRNANANQQTDLNQPLIPRTERVPPNSNLAESDPKKFAALLTEKLQRLKEEQDKLEHMTTSLRSIDAADSSYALDTSVKSAIAQNPSAALTNSVDGLAYTSMLLRSVLSDRDGDDNAQSILEEHVSRVWDSSNGPTPGVMHSPGFRTPNHHHMINAGRTIVAPLSALFSSKGCSTQSSHVVPTPLPTTSRHGHRHQPVVSGGGGAALGSGRDAAVRDALRQSRTHVSVSSRVDSAANAIAIDLDTKRPSVRRSVEPVHGSGGTAAAITSGISRPACQDVPHVPEVANERVMMWVLENEKYSAGKTRCSTDGSDRGSSHKRSSHKSTGSGGGRKVAQQQQPQASHPQHRSNRSESLDRSLITSLSSMANEVSTNHQRTATQDFIMPSNAEDVKRGHVLAIDARAPATLKSRSFTGHNPALPPTSLRDGHIIQTPPLSVIPSSTVTRGIIPHAAVPLSSSCEDLSLCSVKPDSRKSVAKKPSTVEQTMEQTVIGYYFCDEPIPYRTTIPGRNVTLGQFKQHIAKKGNYRFFFKTVCDEFESGVVNEEVTMDSDILPLWEGKVVGKVERL